MTSELTTLLPGISAATGPADPALDDALAALPAAVTGVRLDERLRALELTVDGVAEADLLALGGERTDLGGVPLPAGGWAYAQAFRRGPHSRLAAYRPTPDGAFATLVVVWPGAGGGPELHARTGTLRVLGRVVGAGTTRLATEAFRVDGPGRWWDRGGGEARLTVDDGAWAVDLHFPGDRLAAVTLYSHEPRAGDWDEAAERDRRARHDAWLAGAAGDHPWGSVWSGYDERAGFSAVVVRFADAERDSPPEPTGSHRP